MQIVVFTSRKGGAGKTTLARSLAVEAELRGEGPVALVDVNPQGGLAAWWNRRASETPAFTLCEANDLPGHILRLRAAGFRFASIDTPPSVEDVARTAIRVASLVVVPVRPSLDDLDAVGATIDIAEAEERPMVFLVSQATKRAKITGEAAVVLSQHGTVAPSTIHQSVAFPGAAVVGQTVREQDPGGSPALEIRQLWEYVRSRLSKPASKPSQPASKLTRKRSHA